MIGLGETAAVAMPCDSHLRGERARAEVRRSAPPVVMCR